MSCLQYRGDELFIDDVRLADIASQFGTPCYVYSRAIIEKNWHSFNNSFNDINHRICYAVKANSNLTILRLLANLGSGFDIVSLGELERVIAAGGNVKNIVFSGVGKQEMEIEHAIQYGIHCFDVESEAELIRINTIALRLNTRVDIALRINPDIDARTHSYISTGLKENKFGIDMNDVIPLCHKISSLHGLNLIGIASHIGSQIVDLDPFTLAIDRLLEIYSQLKEMGTTLKHINIGGGLGIIYHDEHPPEISAYAKMLSDKLRGYPIELMLEPGRAIVGNAGILLTKIEYLKHNQQRNFAIIDAGMNDLLRPALYHAWQNILPAMRRHAEKKSYDIAGPVCESADFLGKDRLLAIEAGDLLAVDSAGAYGFSMSSNYNSRCRPAEVLVEGHSTRLIRRRETIIELFSAEIISI